MRVRNTNLNPKFAGEQPLRSTIVATRSIGEILSMRWAISPIRPFRSNRVVSIEILGVSQFT